VVEHGVLERGVRRKQFGELERVCNVSTHHEIDVLDCGRKRGKAHVVGPDVLAQTEQKQSISRVLSHVLDGLQLIAGGLQDVRPAARSCRLAVLPRTQTGSNRWREGVSIVVSKHRLGDLIHQETHGVFRNDAVAVADDVLRLADIIDANANHTVQRLGSRPHRISGDLGVAR